MRPFKPNLLPPKEIDWGLLVSLVGNANSSLARYDGILQGLVNPHILLSPLSKREAVLSSRIEGTQASLDEVLRFEADPVKEQSERFADIQEIINYDKAMVSSIGLLKSRPLSLNVIRKMHFVLMDSVRGWNKGRGDFRKTQNYIAPPGVPIDRATYVPPDPMHMPELLDNFEKYIHHDEKDRLVQLALIHAQFELIHPFLDGNGRVGRLLIPLFLYEKKMIAFPAFYMSAYLEAHREEYYSSLRAVSEKNDFQGWISFFLKAVSEQAQEDTEKAKAIQALYQQIKPNIAGLTRSQFSIHVLDTLFKRPIFSSPQFTKLSRIPKPSAARILTALEKGKLIRVVRAGRGKRPTIYTFPKLIKLVS